MIKTLEKLAPDQLPQVIFLDAMGTLFDLKDGVGKIYQKYAFKYGVEADAQQIEQAFMSSFKSASPLAFLTSDSSEIEQEEFDWWRQVVSETFSQLNLREKFINFEAFFTEIYFYFGTKEPWYVFPDTIESLNRWHSRGIELGVISNFDSRLLEILNILELERFFTSVTISSTAGFAKPNAGIFQIALAKHNSRADRAWHIGDSIKADYEGARKAGLSSFWLNRPGQLLNIENQLPNLCSLG